MTQELQFIGFSIGALALGLWAVLGVYWLTNYRGLFRIALVWMALHVIGTTGIRVQQQISHWESETFGWIDWVRLFLNISLVGLGLFLAKYGRKITNEEGLKS